MSISHFYLIRLNLVMLAALLPIATAQNPHANDTDGNGHDLPSYSPVRPPAIPLAVRSPYTSVWSSTAGRSTLNSQTPVFWTGDHVGWEGIVVVDGNAYEYMGDAIHDLSELSYFNSSVPQDVKFDSQFSNFTFTAGPVRVTASFFSPVTPKDVCRSSIPLSYLTTSVQSNNGQPHHIHFYSDINSGWLGINNDAQIYWDLYKGVIPVNSTGNSTNPNEEIFTWIQERKGSYTFGEASDFPQWGNLSYTTSPLGAANFSYQSGYASTVRLGFLNNLILNNNVIPGFYGSGNRQPVFAFAHDFGIVSQASARYTVGSIQNPIVRYIHTDGVSNLKPWWQKCYGDLHTMIKFHWDDFYSVHDLAYAFESQLRSDVNAFYEINEPPTYSNCTVEEPMILTNGTDQYGQQYEFDPNSAYGFVEPTNGTGIAIPFVSEVEEYYAIVALSARQVMASYVYAVPPTREPATGTPSDTDDPLMFQKEISSNGNINTVDVLYPATPFFLYANPDLLKYNLQPLYEFQEDQFYPNGYCIHDLGAHFPNATGHVEGNDEYMPVEESANFILMSYAYYKFTGDVGWLTSHYELLKQFTQFLISFTLITEAQLSTDDFADRLVNQTNLAIKGIVGLQAMSSIARLAGNTYDALNFSITAKAYYEQWEYFSIDPIHKHTTLAYQWRSSWGLLYNIYFDKLLNMGLVNESVYSMQSDWYATVSQIFGVPLDNRHHYTKSDWEVWTAATCLPNTRRLLINSIAYWLNETSTDLPFTDLYEVVGSGHYPEVPNSIWFRARPVAGGHFALLAMGKTGQTASSAAGNTSGSLFPKNSTEPLPPPQSSSPAPPPRKIVVKENNSTERKVTIISTNRPRWLLKRPLHFY
ncbi:hypothetical protein F5X99DRAFT_431333 [Biscogniauxia marginata]|nr:hypothetical protein F5X99DRAFT_431333 [Biscogniauxia marginata]